MKSEMTAAANAVLGCGHSQNCELGCNCKITWLKELANLFSFFGFCFLFFLIHVIFLFLF